ncbi:MAG: hypothetical protein ACT4N2_03290 [Hyphomicrobium sp.]
MTKTLKRASLAVAALAAIVATAGTASAYSGRVKSACKSDFYRFCPSYKVNSPQLKACMRSAGGNISGRCRDALADGGFIARKYHSRSRG